MAKQNPGKLFEQDFIDSFPMFDIFTFRLRDSASAWGEGASKLRFTSSNPCDFLVFSHYNNTLLMLELKSFKGKSIPFTNIKSHQIQALTEKSKLEGVRGLFILNFRDLAETYALDAKLVDELYREGKKSIPLAYMKKHGELIEQKLKKVRYTYNIDKLIK
ncbi:Holliday junction resolvase RecU [Clostridium saccharoperbutylacetonicum]|uniref:Holliday junction resolvase RecU n=1 Tax=Clostridium saccharoperbutylacetonicum TaxID=36745 RepID=UPI0039EA9E86